MRQSNREALRNKARQENAELLSKQTKLFCKTHGLQEVAGSWYAPKPVGKMFQLACGCKRS